MDQNAHRKQMDRLLNRIGTVIISLLYATGVAAAIAVTIRRIPGEHYYDAWAHEGGYFTFTSSLQYFIAGLAAFLCFWVARACNTCGGNRTLRSWLWIPAFLGFMEATYDEWFMIHEHVLTRLSHAFPWMRHLYFNAADDMFVISCGIGALIFTAFILRELWPTRRARGYYVLGIFLLLLAGLLDYLPSKSFQQRLPLGLEELSEYFAGASFAIAFILYLLDRFKVILFDWLQRMSPSSAPTEEPVLDIKDAASSADAVRSWI